MQRQGLGLAGCGSCMLGRRSSVSQMLVERVIMIEWPAQFEWRQSVCLWPLPTLPGWMALPSPCGPDSRGVE